MDILINNLNVIVAKGKEISFNESLGGLYNSTYDCVYSSTNNFTLIKNINAEEATPFKHSYSTELGVYLNPDYKTDEREELNTLKEQVVFLEEMIIDLSMLIGGV